MVFRKALPTDIERLAELRKIQLKDEGQNPDVNMDAELHRYFRTQMADGNLVEWVAEDDGKIVATAGIIFMSFPPAFTNPDGHRGYVTNMYTADEYRGQGIATRLLQKLEREAQSRGITRLVLHASEMGRRVYAKSGFEETHVVMEKSIAFESSHRVTTRFAQAMDQRGAFAV